MTCVPSSSESIARRPFRPYPASGIVPADMGMSGPKRGWRKAIALATATSAPSSKAIQAVPSTIGYSGLSWRTHAPTHPRTHSPRLSRFLLSFTLFHLQFKAFDSSTSNANFPSPSTFLLIISTPITPPTWFFGAHAIVCSLVSGTPSPQLFPGIASRTSPHASPWARDTQPSSEGPVSNCAVWRLVLLTFTTEFHPRSRLRPTSPRMSYYKTSPNSSRDGLDSMDGTPQTKLTAFSPDDARSIKPSPMARSAGTPMKSSYNDPFVSTESKPKAEQKLSATASTFQPFGLKNIGMVSIPQVPVPGTTDHLNAIIAAESDLIRDPITSEVLGAGQFSTDTKTTRSVKIESLFGKDVSALVESCLEALGKRGLVYKGSKRIFTVGNAICLRFSNIEDATMIYNVVKKEIDNLEVSFISSGDFARIVSPQSRTQYSKHEGQVLLRANFTSKNSVEQKDLETLRDILSIEGTLCAWRVYGVTEGGCCQLIAEYHDSSKAQRAAQRFNGVIFGEHPNAVGLSISLYTPDIENSFHYDATGTPTKSRSTDQSRLCDAMGSMSMAKDTHLYQGNGHNIAPQAGLAYVAGTAAAFGLPPNAVPVVMNGIYTPTLMAPLHQQYLQETPPQSHFSVNGVSPFTPLAYATQQFVPNNGEQLDVARMGFQPAYSQDMFYSPSSAGSPRGMTFLNRPTSTRRQNAVKIPHHIATRNRHPNPAAGHHNHVDIERIQAGSDVRTTVMLRNIPNKVDQSMLKSIVDESSRGKYDFMYLRIDFSNNCNVGYAFINFADPLDIIPFVKARSNQKWHRFKSDKVAEVSYATIQGRDCLIQKFRNSSVMLEPPHYRPKLFFTDVDRERVGQEDVFPSSDNASKLKRSCENAEHVGLFAPSAGQHLRDEQRRRRSQYDRGTSLAEREEYGFDDGFMHQPYLAYPQY